MFWLLNVLVTKGFGCSRLWLVKALIANHVGRLNHPAGWATHRCHGALATIDGYSRF